MSHMMCPRRCPICNCTAIIEIFGKFKCLHCGNTDFLKPASKLSQIVHFQGLDGEFLPENVVSYDQIKNFFSEDTPSDDFSILSENNSCNYGYIFKCFNLVHGNKVLKNKLRDYLLSEPNESCKKHILRWFDDEILSVFEYLSYLESPNVDLRSIAISQFKRNRVLLPDSELLSYFKSPNKDLRSIAISQFKRNQVQLPDSELLSYLKNPDKDLRSIAINQFKRNQVQLPDSELLSYLKDPDKDLRSIAISQFRKNGVNLPEPEYLSFLESPYDDLRLFAIDQYNDSQRIFAVTKMLLNVLEQDPSVTCRALAFKLLMEQKSSIETPLLFRILEHALDARFRLYAFKYLLEQNVSIKITSIMVALNDNDKRIVLHALNEAASIKDVKFIEPIKRIYYSTSDVDLKPVLIKTLCQFGKKTAKEAKEMDSKKCNLH